MVILTHLNRIEVILCGHVDSHSVGGVVSVGDVVRGRHGYVARLGGQHLRLDFKIFLTTVHVTVCVEIIRYYNS